jgi:hypothetical protein
MAAMPYPTACLCYVYIVHVILCCFHIAFFNR